MTVPLTLLAFHLQGTSRSQQMVRGVESLSCASHCTAHHAGQSSLVGTLAGMVLGHCDLHNDELVQH